MLYFIRRKRNLKNTFEIAKFDADHDVPIDNYLTNAKIPTCSCPAYKSDCKHVKMVEEYVAMGCPVSKIYLGDKAPGEWIDNPFTQTDAMEELLNAKC